MDIFAHALWASAGVAAAHRRWPMARGTVAATVVLAALPDVVHMLPMLAWSLLGDGNLPKLWAYAVALPSQEPAMPPIVALWAHHLHCTFHSAIVAGLVTLLAWAALRRVWLPLLGWWSHIVIDIFTHSADFYPVPVLYPITQRGFDGIAWNTPWFLVLNYVALVCVGLWLFKNSRVDP